MIKNKKHIAASNEIILLDLFSGTGGFAKGFEEAGFHIKKHYYSEIDKFSVANYQYNFKTAINLGDVTKINTKKIIIPTKSRIPFVKKS